MDVSLASAARRLTGALAILYVAAACGGQSGSSAKDGRVGSLRLGYFANLTHAVAVAGVESGRLQRSLGPGASLETKIFNAGPPAVESLLSGALDASFVGPNPAINAFVRSGGAVRVVSGAASGGASLVVRPGLDDPGALRGKRLATPQLGNTQDVALRTWLKEHGLATTLEGGGDVVIQHQENAQTLQTFRTGAIDGAWVPEPWGSRLVLEGGGKVLVDEADLWPGGRFVTTHLLVRTDYLRDHPETIRRLIQGEIETIDWLNANPQEGRRVVNEGLAKITGKALPEPIIEAAWSNLTFTYDPIATSLPAMAANAKGLGLLPPGKTSDIAKIYDLRLLESLLRDGGREEPARP
ncbi:MAG: ABC transporter substrate-binding protein [Actinomycetota bacterium]